MYLMKKKYEALNKFMEFKVESEKQLGRHNALNYFVLIKVVSICLLDSFLFSRSMRFYLNLVLQELHNKMEWWKE